MKEELIEVPKWGECTYCGIGANSVDYIVPVSYSGKSQKKRTKGYERDKTVPACSECNSLLSNYSIFTIHERAEYIAEPLANRPQTNHL